MSSHETETSIDSEISRAFTYYLSQLSCLLRETQRWNKNNQARDDERMVHRKNRIRKLQQKLSVVISRQEFTDAVPTLSYIINNATADRYQNNFDTFVDTYEILIHAVSPDARYQVWLNTNEAILRHSVPLFERLSHRIMHEQLDAHQLRGNAPTSTRKM